MSTKKQPYIVTAYSGKYDGLLYVVDAENEVAAMRQVCEIEKAVYLEFTDESDVAHSILIQRQDDETEEQMIEYVAESYMSEGGPRRFWELAVAPLVHGKNIRGAVIW